MSITYTSQNFKEFGPRRLVSNCDAVHVVVDPLKADTFAATLLKSIATAPMIPGDFSFSLSGEDLRLDILGKAGIDPSNAALLTEDLALAYVDTAGTEVLLVLDATDRVVPNEAGDTVDIPAGVFFSRESTITP